MDLPNRGIAKIISDLREIRGMSLGWRSTSLSGPGSTWTWRTGGSRRSSQTFVRYAARTPSIKRHTGVKKNKGFSQAQAMAPWDTMGIVLLNLLKSVHNREEATTTLDEIQHWSLHSIGTLAEGLRAFMLRPDNDMRQMYEQLWEQ